MEGNVPDYGVVWHRPPWWKRALRTMRIVVLTLIATLVFVVILHKVAFVPVPYGYMG